DGQAVVDEDPDVVVTAEIQRLTALVLEEVLELGGEVEVASGARRAAAARIAAGVAVPAAVARKERPVDELVDVRIGATLLRQRQRVVDDREVDVVVRIAVSIPERVALRAQDGWLRSRPLLGLAVRIEPSTRRRVRRGAHGPGDAESQVV